MSKPFVPEAGDIAVFNFASGILKVLVTGVYEDGSFFVGPWMGLMWFGELEGQEMSNASKSRMDHLVEIHRQRHVEERFCAWEKD